MKCKIIVLVLSLAACLAVESGLQAAAEPVAQRMTEIEENLAQAKAMGLGSFADLGEDLTSDIIASLPAETRGKLAQTSRAFSSAVKSVLEKQYHELINYWKTKPITSVSLAGHTGPVAGVAFTSDGDLISVGKDDEIIKLWNVNKCTEIKRFDRHPGNVNLVAFSPESKVLAASYTDRVLRVWNVETGKEIYGFRFPIDIRCLTISSDGKTLALGFCDFAGIVDLTNRKVRAINDFHRMVMSLEFSPDGKTLVSTDFYDNLIRLWDLRTLKTREIKGPDSDLRLLFSTKGKLMAYKNGVFIEVWDVKTGKQTAKILDVNGKFVSILPDVKLLASASSKNIKLFDVPTGELITDLPAFEVLSLAFSPDGKTLAAGLKDGTIIIWPARQ